MIEFKKGNIFDSKMQVLVNPVNCVGVMGAGLALKFKEKYPKMFDYYSNFCNKKLIKIGMLQLVYDKRWILLFPTKDDWRNPSKIQYIEDGLDDALTICKVRNAKSIAFPALGCGYGGLEWEDVRAVMIEKLSKLDIPIEIYEPK